MRNVTLSNLSYIIENMLHLGDDYSAMLSKIQESKELNARIFDWLSVHSTKYSRKFMVEHGMMQVYALWTTATNLILKFNPKDLSDDTTKFCDRLNVIEAFILGQEDTDEC